MGKKGSTMKGFAKIFEAIIASVILLASLTFFFVPDVKQSGWDDASLQVLAQDTLEGIYLNGTLPRYVKEDNYTPLNALISSILPKTVDFSIDVEGLPNKIIYISCVDCSQVQLDDLSAILTPKDFAYKGQNISIRVENLSLGTSPINENTNTIFFFDKNKISTYSNQINGFLNASGSVFLFGDLTQSDVNGTIADIFNLSWAGNTGQPGVFDDVYNSSKISHNAARYFANLSGRHLANVENEDFVAFIPSGVAAGNDNRDIIRTDNGRTYARGNHKNKGRAVWFGDYNRANHSSNNTLEVDRLMKSTIMWASGEKFKLDLVKKTPAPIHFKSSIFVNDEDTYIVELTIWRVFF